MSIIQENIRRNAILDAEYDPFLGIGSTIKRQNFILNDYDLDIWIPEKMFDKKWVYQLAECENITDFINKHRYEHEEIALSYNPIETVQEMFMNERLDQDFEFWASSCIHIFDKDNFKDVPFILRGAQRKLLFELEDMRMSGIPIRIVLLKARQWGGSTLVDMYGMFLQQRHRENWHMTICAQDDAVAGNIASMYDYAVDNYPLEIGKLVRIKGSSKNRIDSLRGGRINIGSVNNPKQFRGYNNAIVHMSETGIWEDTPKRAAMEVVAALKETVPDQPYTMIVEESTAKGLNYFYDSWLKAIKGETRYRAVFVAWWEINRCRISVEKPEEFIKTWTDYEWFQWKTGATIEGIAWYRSHKADKGYDDWMMMEENPTTPDEAFQSSGQKVFPPTYIDAMIKDTCDPEFVGDIFADGRIGPEALKNIRFEELTTGWLKIWKKPEFTHDHRYLVIVDIGGIWARADYSVISVIDRIGLTYSDPFIEGIVTWKGHIDQDLLAWKAAQIAQFYDNALLVVEFNSLKKLRDEEGSHYLTILNQIKDHYKNLYIRNNEENVGSEFVPKYGYHTNAASKGKAIDAYKAAARERMNLDNKINDGIYFKENDIDVCKEAKYYETKPDGSQGAVKGQHDDQLMTRMIGTQVAIYEMPFPRLKKTEPVRPVKKVRSESSF